MANSAIVADITALQAVSPAAAADAIFLGVRGLGWYEYRAASTAIQMLPHIVRPSSVAANAAGRWFRLVGDRLQDLTDAATITIDASVGNACTLNMLLATGTTRALADPTNLIDGQQIQVWVRQPSAPPTGGLKINLSSIWQVRGGAAVSLNPAANGITLIQGQYLSAFGKILTEIGAW